MNLTLVYRKLGCSAKRKFWVYVLECRKDIRIYVTDRQCRSRSIEWSRG